VSLICEPNALASGDISGRRFLAQPEASAYGSYGRVDFHFAVGNLPLGHGLQFLA
jgi:hypothetical protein